MELTDDDRAAITGVYNANRAQGDWDELDEMIYLAGKRAGMLEAANIADRFDGHLPADVDGASDAIRDAASRRQQIVAAPARDDE